MFSPLMGVNTSFALSLRAWSSDASISSNSSMSATRMSPFQIPPAGNTYPRNTLGKTLGPNWSSLDRSFAGTGFDHCSKRFYWAVTWYSEPPFTGCLPIRQEILNISQIAVAFHGLRPPFSVQTWLQQHRRRPFLHSSLSNPICFWSVWCWRTMIPGEIFTSFAESKGIVSINDFRIPIGLQELLQALLCFLRSFCFTWVGLWPLSCQILYHNSVSMIVTRFTFFTENFVMCGYQVTKISALGTTVPARLLQEALVISVSKQKSQFWSFGKCM